MNYHCNLCAKDTPHTIILAHWDNAYYVDRKIYDLIQCQHCALAEVQNKPSSTELVRYYPKHYYSYDTSRQLFFRIKRAVARIATSLPRPLATRLLLNDLYTFPASGPNPSVLDVGCGDGSALRVLRDLGFTRLYGTEIDADRCAELQGHGIEVTVTADVATAPLPNGAFDVVRLSHVLEHVFDPSATIYRCRQLLKPHGTLLVAVPNFDSPARRLFRRYFCGLQLPTHLYHFNKRNLSQLLIQYGFQIKHLYTVGYSGFSSSLLTLLRDRFRIAVPAPLANALILAFAPIEVLFDVAGAGYITTVEASLR